MTQTPPTSFSDSQSFDPNALDLFENDILAKDNDLLAQNNDILSENDVTNLLFLGESQPERANQGSGSDGDVTSQPARKGMSLQTKTALTAAVLGIIPLAIVGYLAQDSGRSVSEQVSKAQLVRTELLAESFSQFLVARGKEVEALSENSLFTQPQLWATSNVTQKEALLNSAQETLGFADSIVFFDPTGKPLFQSDSDRPFTGDSYGDRNYFQEARDRKQVTINGPGLNSSGLLRVEYAAPVIQSNGKLVGVIRMRVPGDKMTQLFQTYEDNNDEWSLINSEGVFFASSDPDRLSESATKLLPEIETLQTVDNSVVSVVSNELGQGGEELVAYVPFDLPAPFSDTRIGAAIDTEISDSLASSRNLTLRILVGAAIAAALVAGIASFLAQLTTRRILKVASAVSQIGEGSLDVRLPADNTDELGMLSNNVNGMASRMQQLVSEQALSVEQAVLLADITATRVFNAEQSAQVFDKAISEARVLLGADRVVIYRLNTDNSGYISNESVAPGWARALDERATDACIPQPLLDAYRDGRIMPCSDVFSVGYTPEHLNLLTRLQIKSNLVAPILNQGQLSGLLVVHHCARKHQWQDSEISFTRQLALQCGSLLERVAFLTQIDIDAERARLIRDFTNDAATLESVNDLLEQVSLDKVRQGLQSDRVIVYTFDEDWKGKVISESVAPGWPPSIGAEIADPCFAESYVEKYRNGRVQATPDIYNAGLTECHLQQLEPFAVRANLVVPILQGDRLLGLLIAHQCSGVRNWMQEDIDFFSRVSDQLGAALDRAALLESQKLSKEQLQKRALELLMEVDPIGRGDLTVRATVTEDEIGTIADSYNSTVSNLREIVEQVQSAARQVKTTTDTSEASIRELSEEALRQAEEVTVALDRIDAMTQSIRKVATSAEQAELAVKQATATVTEGDRAMNRTVDGILSIRDTVAEASKKVKRLGDSMQRVSKVVKLIGTFAAQTNLLALNASMEAARAGEEGRGFAVVADQVRDLARQSADATAEISKIVTEIQTETEEVVLAMEAGTTQVTTGTRIVSDARQSLNQIAKASNAISELVEQISQAAEAQSRDSELVAQTMTDVATTSSKTSSSASQVSDSFKDLLTVAQSLQANVSQFKVE